MTLKTANELDVLRTRLKKYFDTYTEDSLKIQKELDDADAPKKDCEIESEAVRETEEEIGAVKMILKTKLAEWDVIKEREKQDDLDRREKQRLDDWDRREKEKEEESRKAILLHLHQQHNNTQGQTQLAYRWLGRDHNAICPTCCYHPFRC
jgi:hypothetical protein